METKLDSSIPSIPSIPYNFDNKKDREVSNLETLETSIGNLALESLQSVQKSEKELIIQDKVVVKTKIHPCCTLGLDPNYIELQEKKLKEYETQNKKIESIRDSEFKREYGTIHREDKMEECFHCEKKHKVKILSSKETNEIVALFQEKFLKQLSELKEPNKLSTMVGAAQVKFKGSIVKSYITHSGRAPEEILNIYKKLNAKVIDYTTPFEVTANESDKLLAIHTDSALNINGNKFISLYGKTISSYDLNSIIENKIKTEIEETLKNKQDRAIKANRNREEAIKELEEIKILIEQLPEEKIEQKVNTPENKPKKKQKSDRETLKDKQNRLISRTQAKIQEIPEELSEKEIEIIKEKVKNEVHKSYDSKYGSNFGNCAAQKLIQQIGKDFGNIFKPESEDYQICMTEAWIQSPTLVKSEWSQIHPVHSCQTCAFIVPHMLCGNDN